jgi:hypothetical protein
MQLLHSTPGTRPSRAQVDPGYLQQIAKDLSFPRPYGTPQNQRAAEMVSQGLRQATGSCFAIGETNNLCSGNPEKARILIGAHYDSVPNSPGADDNASAVAVLLAAARVIGARDDVFYVAFNAEEAGFLGSREFVHTTLGRMPLLQEAHILEMVGYRDRRPQSQRNPIPPLQAPTVGDFLGIVANDRGLLEAILEEAAGICVPVVGLAIPEGLTLDAIRQLSLHLLRSDHIGFWEKNVPAVMWTDTSEFRNPHYHKVSDTPETLDYEFMSEVGALLVNVVQRRNS